MGGKHPFDLAPPLMLPKSEWLRLEIVLLFKLSLLIDFFMIGLFF